MKFQLPNGGAHCLRFSLLRFLFCLTGGALAVEQANYAHQQELDMIPLVLTEGFKPKGWLGLILGTRMWYAFWDADADDDAAFERRYTTAWAARLATVVSLFYLRRCHRFVSRLQRRLPHLHQHQHLRCHGLRLRLRLLLRLRLPRRAPH